MHINITVQIGQFAIVNWSKETKFQIAFKFHIILKVGGLYCHTLPPTVPAALTAFSKAVQARLPRVSNSGIVFSINGLFLCSFI